MPSTAPPAQPVAPVPILDAHQHIVNLASFPYAWTKGYLPHDGVGFTYDDYRAISAGTGITRSLFMETGVDDGYQDRETVEVLALAAQPGSTIAGVLAGCRPESSEADFAAWLDHVVDPRILGLRRILHVVPDGVSQTEQFVANVRRIGDRGLTFDMNFLARTLPLARRLAERCDNVRLILDHCGTPDIAGDHAGTGVGMAYWRDGIRRLAELPHVTCKISGVLAYCDPAHANLEAVRPYVEHCIDCFGWNRVIWGGDWPVCHTTSNLRDWVAISRAIVAKADPVDQRKLFHRNAERFYRIPGPALS